MIGDITTSVSGPSVRLAREYGSCGNNECFTGGFESSFY